MLAQRAASEGPRWTRAMEDQSAPIPEEITSELGRIIVAWVLPFRDEAGVGTGEKDVARRPQSESPRWPARRECEESNTPCT
jgi:hypothetical protein